MMKKMIQKVVKGEDLLEDEMVRVMDEIMEGKATDAQIGAFITALRMKGETIAEITGAAKVMRAKATPIRVLNDAVSMDRDEINVDQDTIVETCGTGGDVLEALGVNLDVTPEVVEACIRSIGIGFLYAPKLHGAMKYAIGPRREIGIRSIFNVLGPLTNPARANVQVLGVYKPELTSLLAEVLRRLGSTSALVVYGEGSFDEISIVGPTRVSELRDGAIKDYRIEPEDFGMSRANISDIKGGDARRNAAIIREILDGRPGPRRDIVLLNAGAAFYAAGKAPDIREGIQVAAQSIDSGVAAQKLEQLIAQTNP
jgi:anthranilate phosphoribosyltransferase